MITEEYMKIELIIVRELIRLLEVDEGESADEWVKRARESIAKLNMYAIQTLSIRREEIESAILEEIAEAESVVTEHVLDQWGGDELITYAGRMQEAEKAADHLNRNINNALISVKGRKGVLENAINDIIQNVQDNDEEKSLEEIVNESILSTVGEGFLSGYEQSDGITWNLDRYAEQIQKHIRNDFYTLLLSGELVERGVELVKVFKFPEPRDACAALQESGVICIIEREEASEYAQQFPNIHDPEHSYLEMGGHHGADGNCRHLWHNLNSETDRTNQVYGNIGQARMDLHMNRLQFEQMVINQLNK